MGFIGIRLFFNSRFARDCAVNRNDSPAIKKNYRESRFLLITSYIHKEISCLKLTIYQFNASM